MKIHEFLTEDKWCQTFTAIKADGTPTTSKSPEAVRWCLMGAIPMCYPEDQFGPIMAKLERRIWERGHGCVVGSFNDNHGHAEVVALCKELDV